MPVDLPGSDPSPVTELRARLDRYQPDRYPVQHATTRFHLGVALAGAGRLVEAEESLTAACALFRPDQLPAEHAKAANALGAVHRMAGRPGQAAATFRTAASLFADAGLPLEQGAALYNLGLVQQERGGDDAVGALEQARQLLDPARVPAQAAAVARELGTAMLAVDRPLDAIPLLEEAVGLAERAGDRAGMGGAANALGLAHLAAGHADGAVRALEQAVAAHPRSVRPDAHAMAKANLALAFEAQGRPARARLAALQAVATPATPAPVRAQAAGLLDRLGAAAGAVWPVLDEEPPTRWAAIVREEVARWEGSGARDGECIAWVEGQLARLPLAEDLAEALLAAFVELPPPALDVMVRSLLAAVGRLDDAAQERFAGQCSRALARLPVPQLLRMKDTFTATAADLGLVATSW